jgi:hypothetical protein
MRNTCLSKAHKPAENHPWKHAHFMGKKKTRQVYMHGYKQRQQNAAQAAKQQGKQR